MPVTSTPLGATKKNSAVVRRTTLRSQRGGIERSTAWIVLFVSFLGTVAALAGGWTPLIAGIVALKPNWAAIVGGFGAQAVLTALELYYYDTPLVSWGARGVDTALTALGYGPLVLAPLTAALIARQVPSPLYAAWGVIAVFSLLTAWYPESRLVE